MKILKTPNSTQKPSPTAAAESRALVAKAKAAAEQARDAKLLARMAKRRLKQAKHDFKLARKAARKARKEAKALAAAALAVARKAANLRRRKRRSKTVAPTPKKAAVKPMEKAEAVPPVRSAGPKPASEGKVKAEALVKRRRKTPARKVAALPENLSQPVAEPEIPAQSEAGQSATLPSGTPAPSGEQPPVALSEPVG